jgi:hypothetical protein
MLPHVPLQRLLFALHLNSSKCGSGVHFYFRAGVRHDINQRSVGGGHWWYFRRLPCLHLLAAPDKVVPALKLQHIFSFPRGGVIFALLLRG